MLIALSLSPSCWSGLESLFKGVRLGHGVSLSFSFKMEARSIPRIIVMAASSFLFLGLLAYFADISSGRSTTAISPRVGIQEGKTNITVLSIHRKLVGGSGRKETDRIWGGKCRKEDIVIRQGATSPLPSGIPTYTVEITNLCASGCDISGIHLSCGWFSSARLINPKVFKRLRYNDCLLNDGNALAVGATLSFQYANTFLYPLSVSSVSCPS